MKTKVSHLTLAMVALLSLTTLQGCNTLGEVKQTSQFAHLDHMYTHDRSAWRQEMREQLTVGTKGLPPKHLALAIDTFNNPRDKSLCMNSTAQYLEARKGIGPRLQSGTDRRLLAFFAENTLTSTDASQQTQLDSLCLTLTGESVCRQR